LLPLDVASIFFSDAHTGINNNKAMKNAAMAVFKNHASKCSASKKVVIHGATGSFIPALFLKLAVLAFFGDETRVPSLTLALLFAQWRFAAAAAASETLGGSDRVLFADEVTVIGQ